MKEIDLNTWYRKDYFLFYRSFHTYLFNISAEIDVTKAYDFCKEKGISFFIFCLYAFLKSPNEVPQFRHRLIDEKIYDMEILSATTPIMLPDDENHQFTMVECPYFEKLEDFVSSTKKRIENPVSGVTPDEKEEHTKGLVCLNCVPWFSFTGGAHAIFEPHQTMPLMNWGKFKIQNDKKIMPYFMQLNHMFIDGYHVGEFVKRLEEIFNYPEKC